MTGSAPFPSPTTGKCQREGPQKSPPQTAIHTSESYPETVLSCSNFIFSLSLNHPRNTKMLLITHMQILFRKYYNLIQTPLQSFFLIFFLFFDYHLNEKSFFRHFFALFSVLFRVLSGVLSHSFRCSFAFFPVQPCCAVEPPFSPPFPKEGQGWFV